MISPLFAVTVAAPLLQMETASLALLGAEGGDGWRPDGTIPPPPSPPTPAGGGSSRLPKVGDLVGLFNRQAAATLSPAFGEALNMIVEGYRRIGEGRTRREVSPVLAKVATSLVLTVDRDMEMIPTADWTVIASAIYAACQLIRTIRTQERDEDSVARIFLASARLFSHVGGRSRRFSANDLFLQDRLIADTQMSLRGWLPAGRLSGDDQWTLGRNLVRVGIASGSVRWRGSEILPNLMGATHTVFGADPRLFEAGELLAPSQYFGAAAAWRPPPFGEIDRTLAALLDASNNARVEELLGSELSVYLPIPEEDGPSLLAFLCLATRLLH